jgi:uncharacterized protein (TIGR02118 family)
MPVTLLALYRRPDGGEEAQQTFERRYREEHLPLVRETPGLRSLSVERVAQALGESDLFLVTRMAFDDRAALDAALGSEAMRRAGRNLREIAPGLSTLLVLEEETTMSGMENNATGGAGTSGATTGSEPTAGSEPAEGAVDPGARSAAEPGGAGPSAGSEPAEGRTDDDVPDAAEGGDPSGTRR